MTFDLETVVKETGEIFDNPQGEGRMQVPEPPILYRDKIMALEEAGLHSHTAACIFDMRKWQAAAMGFQEINTSDLVRMLMQEPHTDIDGNSMERQSYEWVYNHHTNTEPLHWGGIPTVFKRIVRKGLWYMPPFAKVTVWECIFGKLNYLKRELPYGVVLRINEVKKLNLFNAFHVLAPKEAWEAKTDIDPILVASLWEIPPSTDPKKGSNAGQVAHYFLAQW